MTTSLRPAAAAQAPHRPAPRPVPVRADPRAVLATLWTGAAAVLLLWWHGKPSAGTIGDLLTTTGRLAGLLSGYGVVVLLALMARLPPLERGVGTDRLARWHARVGRWTVCLVVAHGLLIWCGYAATAHTGLLSQGSTLLTSYADVLMATVAGLLLAGVGLVSVRAARRRLRYETWYYLHLYTYLAVALAFSHQFSTGAGFVDDRAARVAWSALYLTVAALLLWYRAAMPVRHALRHRMRVAGVREEAPGVVSVYVSGAHLDELAAEPGQFFRWRFLTRESWWAANPYSLSAAPRPDLLRITVKDLGDHSRALARLRPGTRVFAEGPYGAFTARPSRGSRDRSPGKVLLVAGGVGITPVRALLETLPAAPGDITVLYRAGSWSDVVFRAELETLAAARGARLRFVVGHRAELGGDPLSAAAFTANVPGLPGHEAYVCGPPGMTSRAVAALRAAGVPPHRIHHESFEF